MKLLDFKRLCQGFTPELEKHGQSCGKPCDKALDRKKAQPDFNQLLLVVLAVILGIAVIFLGYKYFAGKKVKS